jgi:hypothetical protein
MPLVSEQAINDKVAARLGRQSLLSDGPTRPVLWWLLDEIAIRRPVGGPGTMAGQLRHLADLCRSSRSSMVHTRCSKAH